MNSILKVAPVFLETPKRIEDMLFLCFVTPMIVGLIERKIRKNMKRESMETLAILPSKMKIKAPTWNNISNFFRNLHLSIILQEESTISSVKGVKDLHWQVLQVFPITEAVYRNLKDKWWQFEQI